MRISVIIPTYNRAAQLEKALFALSKQHFKGAYEVIVVNDGGTDHTDDVIAKARAVHALPLHYLHQDNKGPGAARNHAIQKARGEIILMIGDDIYLEPDALTIHDEFHRRHPQEHIGVLGFVTWARSLEISPLMSFMERGGAILGRMGGSQFAYDLLKGKTEADERFFYTAHISLKRSVLNKEKFDESFHGYGWEDIDLGIRLARDHKFRLLYAPQAIGYHDHPMTEESFEKRMIAVGKASHAMSQRYPDQYFLPSDMKKKVLSLLSHRFVASVSSILWPDLYWYGLSKKYFLQGLDQGYTRVDEK